MSVERQLLKEQWDSFAAKLLPRECGIIQRREMKRAFYAGALALLYGVMSEFDPGTEATAADSIIIESVAKELDDFAEMVKQRRA